jgi:hypothetical protein
MPINVFFSLDAIHMIKKITKYLSIHDNIYKYIYHFYPIRYPRVDIPLNLVSLESIELKNDFEQKLASFINTNAIRECYENNISNSIIEPYNVLCEIYDLINNLIVENFNTLQSEDEIATMLQSYTISILSSICKTNPNNSRLLGEAMKKFIILRNNFFISIPKELSDITEGFSELVGSEKSPLTPIELNSIHHYLGSDKNIYVHILLNCLFDQFNYYNEIDNSESLTSEEKLIFLCKSKWFFLFIFSLDI